MKTIFFSGSEVEVLSDMLSTGAFAHVYMTMIKFHSWLAKTKKRQQQSITLQQGLFVLAELTDSYKFLKLDNELYGNSYKPLPECDNSSKM
jgi:hypothetical protein